MDEKIYYPDLTNSKSFKIDKNKYKEMYQELFKSRRILEKDGK